jgi:threonine aldolase
MIDFRSDTVTRPTAAMRNAMAAAPVGDDVYGEDPTVNALEARAADMLGKDAALFVASGTMANLLGILAHCERGDEYLVAEGAHTYLYEGGGAAVLGSVQPQPIRSKPNGAIAPDDVRAAVKDPSDSHFARTRLLALENAYWGRVQSLSEMTAATDVAREFGLGTHLDGARFFNAVVALDQPAAALAAPFDTVSVCLSKGLGAPVGSVLVGAASVIERARRWRKVVGGGWRQAGMLAAAGLHALEHHVARLADDHARARRFAEALSDLPGVEVDLDAVQTNMVLVDVANRRESFDRALAAADIRVGGRGAYRFVMHLDIDDAAVDRALDVVKAWSETIP